MPAADSATTATTACWGSRWLSGWPALDDKADAEVRRSANTAMDMIDAMHAELHLLRSRLVTEIRISDEATGRRVDDLLARCKEEPR